MVKNTIFVLAWILTLFSTNVSANEAICDLKNHCFQGNGFRAVVNLAQKKGNYLIISLRYKTDGRTGIRVKIDKKSKGYVEVLDSQGNLYKADPTKLTNAYASYNSIADLRLRVQVNEKFKPPFDLSVRSGDDGSVDILNIPLK